MAIIISLVQATTNKLVYLAQQDDQAAGPETIPNDGGASPDLETDILSASPAGALSRVIQARKFGVGSVISPGALSAAQARALFMGEDPTNAVLTNRNVPRCNLTLEKRSGTPQNWTVIADVDGQGDPVITVTTDQVLSSTALITLEFDHTQAS